MAQLEPVGHQLVIVTLVFGIAALATLSVRLGFRIKNRKYDVSDTCLVAAMVCFTINERSSFLTDRTGLWPDPKRHSDRSRREVRLRKG